MTTPTDFRPLSAIDLEALTAFHLAHLGGHLTTLGRPWVRLFYAVHRVHAKAVGYAALREGKLVGIVSGALPGFSPVLAVVSAKPFHSALEGLRIAFRQPRIFLNVLRSLVGSSSSQHRAELHFLAVDGAWRGKGIGKALVRQFAEAMVSRGVSAFELAVARDNRHAIDVYLALGGTEVAEFDAGGLVFKRILFERLV
jgi:ribosomal protein S18 acetylase RimI-like enzyme